MRPSRKGQVLEEAARLFSQKGYHATSVRDIAQAVGMSKAGLYSSFTSKESLLEEIYYSIIDEMLDRLRGIVAADLVPAEKLRQAIIWQVAGTAEHVRDMIIYYQERRHLSGPVDERIANKRRTYEALLESILEEGQTKGAFRALDVKVTAFGIAGMCAWTYRWFKPEGRLSSQEIGTLYADLVIHGLLAPSDQQMAGEQK